MYKEKLEQIKEFFVFVFMLFCMLNESYLLRLLSLSPIIFCFAILIKRQFFKKREKSVGNRSKLKLFIMLMEIVCNFLFFSLSIICQFSHKLFKLLSYRAHESLSKRFDFYINNSNSVK